MCTMWRNRYRCSVDVHILALYRGGNSILGRYYIYDIIGALAIVSNLCAFNEATTCMSMQQVTVVDLI